MPIWRNRQVEERHAMHPHMEFEPFGGCGPGVIADLLARCYEPLLQLLPAAKAAELRRDWTAYDEAVHGGPDTVGAAGFLTLVEGHVIGFASWDPRRWPEVGLIGHNCIVPEHQGHGFGGRQIEEILSRFGRIGFQRVEVRTDEHPFFTPARRMYERCGFVLVRRESGALFHGLDTLVYEQVTASAA